MEGRRETGRGRGGQLEGDVLNGDGSDEWLVLLGPASRERRVPSPAHPVQVDRRLSAARCEGVSGQYHGPHYHFSPLTSHVSKRQVSLIRYYRRGARWTGAHDLCYIQAPSILGAWPLECYHYTDAHTPPPQNNMSAPLLAGRSSSEICIRFQSKFVTRTRGSRATIQEKGSRKARPGGTGRFVGTKHGVQMVCTVLWGDRLVASTPTTQSWPVATLPRCAGLLH